MESEYGRYFLSNYQPGPLPSSIPGTLVKSSTSPATATAEARLPPLQRPPSDAQRTTSTGTPGSGSLFRLAPPPPPVNQFSVGSTTPAEKVVKMESLIEQKAADRTRSQMDEDDGYGPTGAVFVDDEESLLGAGPTAVEKAKKELSRGAAGASIPSQPAVTSGGIERIGDGVDSDSDEADVKAKPKVDRLSSGQRMDTVPMPSPQPLTATAAEEQPESNGNTGVGFRETPSNTGEFGRAGAAATAAVMASAPSTRPQSVDTVASFQQAPPPAVAGQDETEMSGKLDQFFQNDRSWDKVVEEVEKSSKKVVENRSPGAKKMFRVQVPKPYPGVQLRKSKRLDDKHPRFLEDGKVVSGEVDETGRWLMIGPENYLPMEVGAIRILQEVENQDIQPVSKPKKPKSEAAPTTVEQPSVWWGCCAGAAAAAVASGSTDLLVTNNDTNQSQTGRGMSSDSALAGSAQGPNATNQDRGFAAAGSPPPSSGSGLAFRQSGHQAPPGKTHLEDYTSAGDLPGHLANPIDPFSDSPDAPLNMRPGQRGGRR
mmetsp:Transcript_15409/g.26967  ORF Transcript_15409/g.26967 Transcript_15409/m.26967 type:complete len:541 (-) Transcript_15409:150-1772(-)